MFTLPLAIILWAVVAVIALFVVGFATSTIITVRRALRVRKERAQFEASLLAYLGGANK